MLSVKNLVKVYKAKGGAETRALDGVSIDFPEKGMVFLLGKSGSGKSTLLNVAGGLDVPTSGEIIVKGKSSRDFTPSDFDSFRNTFIGFIFQEYNLLEEFNIEQNIALALQLQGKKSDAAEVDKLLELVDLKGFNKRKPNTLSGGQRQRVAIARALIKNPEIIMADEPTGALDSETGEQVFETLKKLSEDKLVIVVSHDREFAEEYADRIIELKDGKILSDITKEYDQSEFKGANVNILSDSTVRIKDCSKLSDEDVSEIIKAIKQKGGGEMIILSDENKLAEVKKVCDIKDEKSGGHFEKTDLEKTKPASYDGKNTKFIKSKLPASHAIKIGASGLKTKPVRLAFTILLSVISFTLFGVLSAMMLYDPIYSIAVALQEGNVKTARLEKRYDYIDKSFTEDENGNIIYSDEYQRTRQTLFGEEELKKLNESGKGLDFAGIMEITNDFSANLANKTSTKPYYNMFEGTFEGFTDCGEEYLFANGFTCLAGSYPTQDNEIAVSEYIFDIFKETGYVQGNETIRIQNANYLIGKTLKLKLSDRYHSETRYKQFKISGIYNVGELKDYDELRKEKIELNSIQLKELKDDFKNFLKQSYNLLAFVSPSFSTKYSSYTSDYNESKTIHARNFYGSTIGNETTSVTEHSSFPYLTPETAKPYKKYIKFFPFSGTIDTNNLKLNENEIYIPLSFLSRAFELAQYPSVYFWMYRDKNAEIVYKQPTYKETDGFYANFNGEISFTEKDGYAFIENGKGYIDKNGKYYTQKPSTDASEYRYIDGYYVDMDGKFISLNSADYIPVYACIYEDNNGNFYYGNDNYIADAKNRYEGFYVDEYGNASLTNPQYGEVTEYRGFYINPETREYSIEKKDGFIFTNAYLKNKKTNEIVFARQYYSTFFDENNNPCIDPRNGLISQNTGHYFSYYEMNSDFRKALANLMFEVKGSSLYRSFNSLFSENELDTAKPLSQQDIDIILNHLEQDYTNMTGQILDDFKQKKLKNIRGDEVTLTVKGFVSYSSPEEYCCIISPELVKKYKVSNPEEFSRYYDFEEVTNYIAPADAKYSYLITRTTNDIEQVRFMLDKRDNYSYIMTSSTYKSVEWISYSLDSFKLVFAIAGGVLAALSALMLFNFISASISAKTRDIGILRAVGGRGADVFKIFFSESSIIAAICFALSAVCAGIACYFLNGFFVGSSLHITVLNYGFVEVAFILGISLVVSLLATFIPVYFAAKRSPVESIRSL